MLAGSDVIAQLRAVAADSAANRLAAAAALVQGLDERFAACMIWRRNGERVVLEADAGEHNEECPLPQQGGISRTVVDLNEPVALGNTKADDQYLECYLFAGSELAVPIPGSGGTALGALHVQSDRVEAFTAADRTLLTALAAVIGEWLQQQDGP